MRIQALASILAVTAVAPLVAPIGALSAQRAGTWFCSARDNSRMAGFVTPLFNVSQDDAAQVGPAWTVAIKNYGATPSMPPACQGFAKFAAADSARNQFVAFVTNSLEYRIDKMGWTYRAAPVATADIPATVASAPSSQANPEMAQAKAYCVQNHAGMYDCDGYAQAVADHRQAHPDEWESDHGPRYHPPVHDLEVGIQFHLDCARCLNDQLLTSWARQRVRTDFSAVVISKQRTQASVDAYGDCVARAFVPKMHARPNVDDWLHNLNDAEAGCGSPH